MAEPAAIVTCIALAFGCAGASDAPFWAAAIRLGGKDAGAASAIMNTGCNLGGVSPWITGRIAQRWGWSSAFHAMTLVLALGLVAWLWIDPSRTVIKEGEETN
jgi:dipeptide/tripeptide permease